MTKWEMWSVRSVRRRDPSLALRMTKREVQDDKREVRVDKVGIQGDKRDFTLT
jgi:hypothetical protein